MTKHTKTPWKFERMPEYEERVRMLNRPLADHEGYFRDNDGSWIIQDSEGNRIAAAIFKGKAKRGEAWNAPDPDGKSNVELIVRAVNAYVKGKGGKE
jgi:hypothetical protein